MKTRWFLAALLCCAPLVGPAPAQAPKKDEKKAPAKTPADLALDEFNKIRSDPGAKDPARFQKVIGAGLAYLTQFPTHGGVGGAINNLAFHAGGIDKKQAALRVSFVSLLKLEVTNQKYKEGITDDAKAAIAAMDAAIADFEVRESITRDTLAAFREKLDELAETPKAGRFLAERERSYLHLLALQNAQRAEEQAKKLLEHKEKGVRDMAREELNILEIRKAPYDLAFTALDGKAVDFAQLRGKVVALYFWSSTNGNSTRNLDELRQIHADYRKRGFEIVTVSYDKEEDREKLMKYIKENKLSLPVYFDGKAAKNAFSPKLNIYGVPRLLVFDQKGILQTTIQGSPVGRLTHDLPVNQLEGMVRRLLGMK